MSYSASFFTPGIDSLLQWRTKLGEHSTMYNEKVIVVNINGEDIRYLYHPNRKRKGKIYDGYKSWRSEHLVKALAGGREGVLNRRTDHPDAIMIFND